MKNNKKSLLTSLILTFSIASTALATSQYPVNLNINIKHSSPLEFSHKIGKANASACGFSPRKKHYQCVVKLNGNRFGVAFRNHDTGGTCTFIFNKNKSKIEHHGTQQCGNYYRVRLKRGPFSGNFTINLQ